MYTFAVRRVNTSNYQGKGGMDYPKVMPFNFRGISF